MTELLVGTKKGLFVLEGEPGSGFQVTARAFAGEPVEYALRDPRSGRVHAAVSSPFYGPKVFFTDDPAGEWQQASGVELPEADRRHQPGWITERMLPPGSRNQAMSGPLPRMIPFSSWGAPS